MSVIEHHNNVVFDLEWNIPNTRYRAEKNGTRLSGEIIQFGAVKFDENLETVDTYMQMVRPAYYHKMNKEVEELTEITSEVAHAGIPFQQAVQEFLDWCGEDCWFFSWSDNDIIRLEENMQFYGMSIDDLPACYDMQLMFDDQVTMEDRDFALSYAIWKMGIKPARAHDALNDALNTLEVMRHLSFEEDLEEYAL